MIEIQIPDDIANRLHAISQKTGKTENYYACDAILRFVEDMEDMELAQEVLNDSSEWISLEDLEKELGLEN